MASATARKRTRYAEPRGTYGNLAYAEPAVRPLERGGSEALRPQPKVRTRERAAVHLFYYEGSTTQEIAAILGQRPGTVRSHLSRARQALRERLKGEV